MVTSTDSAAEARDNREWLLAEFVKLLKAQAPGSVLDVGCGAGQLMTSCVAAGIDVAGIDQPGPRLDGLRDAGLTVQAGSADDLPWADGSFDWVTLRHVPHHLVDPARAFGEAVRVARAGVLIAEPSFDHSLASQRGAFAVDCWEKRLDREGGMVHGEVLDLDALLSALPGGYDDAWSVEVQQSLRLRERSVTQFAREARERLAARAEHDPEHTRLTQLLRLLDDSGLSWNGSLCVLIRRRGVSRA